MRVVCAKKESALGLRGAIPGSEALDRKGLADLAREKEPGAGVCRLLEVESEGAAFGERASAIGEADRRDGTLVCLAQAGADEHLGAEHSSPRDWPADLDGSPCRKRGAVAFWRKRDTSDGASRTSSPAIGDDDVERLLPAMAHLTRGTRGFAVASHSCPCGLAGAYGMIVLRLPRMSANHTNVAIPIQPSTMPAIASPSPVCLPPEALI